MEFPIEISPGTPAISREVDREEMPIGWKLGKGLGPTDGRFAEAVNEENCNVGLCRSLH
jgi:hypothetical protein